MLNSSSRADLSSSESSVSDSRRMSFSCTTTLLFPREEFRLDGQLVGGEAHGLLRERVLDTGHLEEDPSRTHDRDPVVRRALARAHPHFGGLLRDRLVGEDADPDLPTTLQVVDDRSPRGLDLARGHPARLL